MPALPPINPRRALMGAAKRLLDPDEPVRRAASDEAPRLTSTAITRVPMSRSRERILANLDEMYREAFERAKASEDSGQMQTLDFAYRREQLYFEVLLDIRDGMDRR
jgi:hypothetical protein